MTCKVERTYVFCEYPARLVDMWLLVLMITQVPNIDIIVPPES